MNTWVRKSFNVGVLSAGVLLMGSTAAQADWNSIGNSGALAGNQTNATTQAPIDICGNAIGTIGSADVGCEGGSWASLAGLGGDWNSIGNSGAGAGNQSSVVTQAPINACGNALLGTGSVTAGCAGGSWATIGGFDAPSMHNHHIRAGKVNKGAGTEAAHVNEDTTLTSVGNSGDGSGNQTSLVTQAPVDACGNAIGLTGTAVAHCVGGSTADAGGSGSTNLFSGFNSGVASGNQTTSLIQIPIDICGNAISVTGTAVASCTGGSTATTGGGTPPPPVGGYSGYTMPGSENAAIAKGIAKANRHMHRHHHMMAGGGSCSPTLTSIGNSGAGSGNQTTAVTQAPIDISGNVVGSTGSAFASSIGGAWATC